MSPPGTVHLSHLRCQHDGGMKCLLKALGGALSTNWAFAKTIRSFLATRGEIAQQGRAGRKDISLDSLCISKLHPGTGSWERSKGSSASPALSQAPCPSFPFAVQKHRRRKIPKEDTRTQKMSQESHQMGLDTRENATPVTYDTGDTGVTFPAEPEWGGNACGPPALPWTPVLLPLPNMPKATACTRHFPERPQPQKLQDDTGILPSLHACKKLNKCSLAGKAKLGRVSCNGSSTKQRKGACNWFL